MAEMQAVQIECHLPAPPEVVYRAFTQATAWESWCCDRARVQAQPGGELRIETPGYVAQGVFLSLKPGQALAFTWHGNGEPPTRVEVDLQAEGVGTRLRFTVTNLGEAQAWAETRETFESLWGRALANLARKLRVGFLSSRRDA
ncbi:MAG: SRPBCC domain-containing protein [Chloroflexota bacterium]